MENWKDYIDQKFQPKQDFDFKTEEDSNTLTVTHLLSGTSFIFFWPSHDWSEIHDVQFHNNQTEGWSGEYNGHLPFSPENTQKVDVFLNPAIETGWMSKDVYLFGKHFTSVVSFNGKPTRNKFRYYSSNLGCLSFILLPIFQLLASTIGKAVTVSIRPVSCYYRKS